MSNFYNRTALITSIHMRHIESPFDVAHDAFHHYKVSENCVNIVIEEDLQVDMDVLTTAAWLHDLEDRTGQSTHEAEKLLQENNLDTTFINKVLLTIREHSLGNKQTTIESQVLFDGDKLEYVNPVRLLWAKQSFEDGFLPRERYMQYYQRWKEEAPNMTSLLHYNYTKNKFNELYENIASNQQEYWHPSILRE